MHTFFGNGKRFIRVECALTSASLYGGYGQLYHKKFFLFPGSIFEHDLPVKE